MIALGLIESRLGLRDRFFAPLTLIRLGGEPRHSDISSGRPWPIVRYLYDTPPHQFRTRKDANETQRTRPKSSKTAGKSTDLIDSPPLITVWLQVRVLPGPPPNYWLTRRSFIAPLSYRT